MPVIVQKTPNPDAMQFLPGKPVVGANGESLHLTSQEARAISPLAQNLFAIDGVQFVFFGPDFVTVTATEAAKWKNITFAVTNCIDKHFKLNQPIFYPNAPFKKAAAQTTSADDPYNVGQQTTEILDKYIRPGVEADGGKISFHHYDAKERIVYLDLQGSCAGCPSSIKTLRDSVENTLMKFINGQGHELIKEVRQLGATGAVLTQDERKAAFRARWQITKPATPAP